MAITDIIFKSCKNQIAYRTPERRGVKKRVPLAGIVTRCLRVAVFHNKSPGSGLPDAGESATPTKQGT